MMGVLCTVRTRARVAFGVRDVVGSATECSEPTREWRRMREHMVSLRWRTSVVVHDSG